MEKHRSTLRLKKHFMNFEFVAPKKFLSFRVGLNPAPHPPPPPPGGRKISRGKTKNPFPKKNRFSFCRVRIEAPRTAQKLLGQNPERKTPFPFSRKNSPPPNQKCKESFFFRGCRVKRGGGGAIVRAYDLGQNHHALRA